MPSLETSLKLIAFSLFFFILGTTFGHYYTVKPAIDCDNHLAKSMQTVLKFSMTEMEFFKKAFMNIAAIQPSTLIDFTCDSPITCAQKSFTQMLSLFHSSGILPVNQVWYAGSFERIWLNDFLLNHVKKRVPVSSSCLEWGTEYMELLQDTCSTWNQLNYDPKKKKTHSKKKKKRSQIIM